MSALLISFSFGMEVWNLKSPRWQFFSSHWLIRGIDFDIFHFIAEDRNIKLKIIAFSFRFNLDDNYLKEEQTGLYYLQGSKEKRSPLRIQK